MVKYTDLEQASRDPSLAIITDSITTQRELRKVYARYKVLPKKQKRYSDYYSNEFLGHSGSGKSRMASTLVGGNEANEADKEVEAVIGELNRIDKCFVNGDADGVREILRRAEANTELYEWNRMRIINECNSALLELLMEY